MNPYCWNPFFAISVLLFHSCNSFTSILTISLLLEFLFLYLSFFYCWNSFSLVVNILFLIRMTYIHTYISRRHRQTLYSEKVANQNRASRNVHSPQMIVIYKYWESNSYWSQQRSSFSLHGLGHDRGPNVRGRKTRVGHWQNDSSVQDTKINELNGQRLNKGSNSMDNFFRKVLMNKIKWNKILTMAKFMTNWFIIYLVVISSIHSKVKKQY